MLCNVYQMYYMMKMCVESTNDPKQFTHSAAAAPSEGAGHFIALLPNKIRNENLKSI